MIPLLGSEFAFIIIHVNEDNSIKIVAGRDPIGVRPLFYSKTDTTIVLSSEVKGLYELTDDINVFPPGHYMIYDSKTNKMTLTQSNG